MVQAKLNNLRIAPRKVRLVVDLIRNKTVVEAERILMFTVKRASDPLLKLLRSAVANAGNTVKLKKEELCITKISVDNGPMLKRGMPRSRGMVHPIQKRMSHVILQLDQIKKK